MGCNLVKGESYGSLKEIIDNSPLSSLNGRMRGLGCTTDSFYFISIKINLTIKTL
jgi:hypothetical protein